MPPNSFLCCHCIFTVSKNNCRAFGRGLYAGIGGRFPQVLGLYQIRIGTWSTRAPVSDRLISRGSSFFARVRGLPVSDETNLALGAESRTFFCTVGAFFLLFSGDR